MMVELGFDDEREPSAATSQAHHDFSVVHGFQVVGANPDTDGWRDALILELETRAARFRQAVDSAIVISNDGVIRWLGDPVARLAPGAGVLAPGAVILADEALPAAALEIVRARIELWLAATLRRVLGPLLTLEGLQEGAEAVRDLARQLARSLGILEREPIRTQIRALGQNDRAELRKHGVRFGAYYVFAPALMKPAARTLAVQLWALHAPGDAGALLDALAQVASSGRTSVLSDSRITREGYRAAGYRPCGERAVRVDVLERLAGIIRAAIVDGQAKAAAPAGQARSNGFVVSGQMTSLTGCAGEQFASILRSMGFRSVEMKRSDFVGSPPAVGLTPQPEGPAGSEPADPALEDAGALTIEVDERTPADILSEAPDEAAADPSRGNSAEPVLSADGSCPEGSTAGPDEAAAVPDAAPAPSRVGESPDDLIVVWRPDRHALSRRGASDRAARERAHAAKTERLPTRPSRRMADKGRGLAAEAGMAGESRRDEPSSTSVSPEEAEARRPPGSAGGRRPDRSDEKHRQTPADRDMARAQPATERKPRPKFDPDSPFAKLIELRSLLEAQAKRP